MQSASKRRQCKQIQYTGQETNNSSVNKRTTKPEALADVLWCRLQVRFAAMFFDGFSWILPTKTQVQGSIFYIFSTYNKLQVLMQKQPSRLTYKIRQLINHLEDGYFRKLKKIPGCVICNLFVYNVYRVDILSRQKGHVYEGVCNAFLWNSQAAGIHNHSSSAQTVWVGVSGTS